MADFNPIGFLEGQAVNRGVGAITDRIPFMPSFYNARYSDPREGIRNSEAAGIIRGDRRAISRYAGRNAGRGVGGALGGLPGALIGGWLGGHVGPWLTGYGWNGQGDGRGAVFGTHDIPHGEVTVGDINDTSGFDNQHIDPWSGAPLPTFSNFGPYSTGYQGLGDTPSGDYPDLPDYSTDSGPEYEGPYSSEHYGFDGPMPSFGAGNQFSYSQAGGGSGAGVWNGGGGMHSFQVNSGSLSASNYGGLGGGGIARGRGRENGASQN